MQQVLGIVAETTDSNVKQTSKVKTAQMTMCQPGQSAKHHEER